MLKKTKKPLKTVTPISQKALKEAYQLVIANLFTSLVKMKTNQSIRLNGIGTFIKKSQELTSGLDGNTYRY